MHKEIIMTHELPLSYRWLKANGINQLVPWYMTSENEGKFANKHFENESVENRKIITFARRQDRDDFAGFEIVDNKIMEKIIYFHPSFSKHKESNLINKEFPDIWTFLKEVVIPDSEEWMTEVDLLDLLEDQ